jgi:hypothetical protein
MLRYQKYSWQVAPLQSLLPLPSGGSKVMEAVRKKRISSGIIT